MDLSRLGSLPIQLVGERIGSVPGPLSGAVFRMTSPVRNMTRWGQLWMRRRDSEFVENFAAMNAWMGNFTDFPQRAFLELMNDHVVENQCFEGRMQIGDRRIDLGSVDVPVLAIAGESDKIVHGDAVWAVREAVASEDVRLRAAPGGHAGVIAGREAPGEVWDVIAEWLGEHEADASE
jgi:polyhydroxyalkanoate synthase